MILYSCFGVSSVLTSFCFLTSSSSSSRTSFENALGFALMQLWRATKGLTQSEPYIERWEFSHASYKDEKDKQKYNFQQSVQKTIFSFQSCKWMNGRWHSFMILFVTLYQSQFTSRNQFWTSTLESLSETTSLPYKVGVRSSYTLPSSDPTCWDYTMFIVVVVTLVKVKNDR